MQLRLSAIDEKNSEVRVRMSQSEKEQLVTGREVRQVFALAGQVALCPSPQLALICSETGVEIHVPPSLLEEKDLKQRWVTEGADESRVNWVLEVDLWDESRRQRRDSSSRHFE